VKLSIAKMLTDLSYLLYKEPPMNEKTSQHYLKKAERFFKTFNLQIENLTPLTISDALKRAARDREDKSRAEGRIRDKKVIQAIQKYGYAKSSWLQLKTAVSYYCKYHGYDNYLSVIEQTNMGLTASEYRRPTKKIKTISRGQVQKLSLAIHAEYERLKTKPKNWTKLNQQAKNEWVEKREGSFNKYGGLASLITLFYLTGCRPIEVMSMKAMGNGVIYIKGAKQSKEMNNGDKGSQDKFARGADRFISLPKQEYQAIVTALVTLKDIGWLPAVTGDIIKKAVEENGYNQQLFNSLEKAKQEDIVFHYRAEQFQQYLDLAQSQFRRTSKKVLNLKKSLCFYTFRHQFSSDLKGDDSFDRKEIAYLLGHLTTKSLDAYGHKRSAKGKRDIDVADRGALKRIHINHSTAEFTKAGPRGTRNYNKRNHFKHTRVEL